MKTLLLPLALFASSALAAEPVFHDFECDTPPGHYSYWSRTLSTRNVSVEGKISVNELRADKRWNPAVYVSFLSESPQDSVGLQIYTMNSEAEGLHLRIVLPGKGNKEIFATIPRTEKIIPFRVSLDATGALKIAAAGQETSAQVEGFTANKLQLSCSTGDFEFQQVRVQGHN